MTPAQRVRKKYPKAYAYRFGGAEPWVIYSGEYPLNESLNVCDRSRRAAWASAARGMKVRRADSKGDQP